MVDDFKKNELRPKQGNCPYKPTVFVIACKTLDQDKVRGKKTVRKEEVVTNHTNK